MSRRPWNEYRESPYERAKRERQERERERRERAGDAAYDAWRAGKDPDEAYDREYDREDY